MNEGPKDAGGDRALVKAAQRGDEQAFRQLVERYQRRVVQLALGMTKDPDEAMDIAQETFVKVHRYLPSFKGASSFFTWTYHIAMNLRLTRGLRKRQDRRVDLSRDEAELGPPWTRPRRRWPARGADAQRRAARQDRGERWQASENHRAILILRELEGLS
jgi:RNA polymerase sigma-70 factor (ECF subfamily)